MLPVQAEASVNPDGALHAYARARLADGEGAADVALAGYRAALRVDPDSTEVAKYSYFQALESGDMALALRSAALLDAAGALPRDGTLLRIVAAFVARDWAGARGLNDRLAQEGNFAFAAPIIAGWIAAGDGLPIPASVSGTDRFAALTRRYSDEHGAFQSLARGDVKAASLPVQRSLSLQTVDLAALRLAFAGRLAAAGTKEQALALLPPDDASYARARADIARGRVGRSYGAPLTARDGLARMLVRLATDISAESSASPLAVRLARMALHADPDGMETRLVAARLLTRAGHAEEGMSLLRLVVSDPWYGALAQAAMVDALAAGNRSDEAIALARRLIADPLAGPERFVRLGQLLAGARDHAGAAAAFRAAQSRYPAGKAPWTLLLLEGSALEQAEQWAQARVVLEQANSLAPEQPVLLNFLGYAQIERRQNLQEALALLKRASALRPEDPAITDSLGWAHFLTGDVSGAVPVLERAALGAPADATINEHLGDALWTAGRRFEARYAWQAASAFAEGDIAARLAAKSREGLKPQYAAP